MTITKTIFTLVLGLLIMTGCADQQLEETVRPADVAERELVPLSLELSLGGDNETRVDYTYDDSDPAHKKLTLSWSEKDEVGVYIKTQEGLILRAGALSNAEQTRTNGDKTCVFEGLAAQKFEGEEYIYMHPDLGAKTVIDFENQYGYIGSTAHIDDYLPIVWRGGSTTGSYQGYVLKLTMTFSEDPGSIRKVTLHSSRNVGSGASSMDRIFPRRYSIDYLALGSGEKPFSFDTNTEGTSAPSATYTDAISLNIQGTGTPVDNGNGTWTATAYLACSEVEKLNVFNSKIRLEVLNHEGKTFTSNYESFKGQGSASNQTLLSSTLLGNNGLHSMARAVNSSGLSMTVINYQYKVNSILGMWNEYGKPYDPNGLMVYEGGDATLPATGSGVMPDQLINNITALRSRSLQSLTGGVISGTPTHTWVLYESQCDGFTNNYMIVRETGGESAQSDHGTDHSQVGTTINNIEITSPTKVYFTFLGEFAWWQNLIGYYHYNKNSVPSSSNDITKIIIFPNVSKPGHEPFNTSGQPQNNIGKNEDAPLKLGETVKLLYTNPETGAISDEFPNDEVIGFFLMQNPQANGFQQSAFSLMNWNVPRYFSNQAWNADNAGWPTTGRLNTFVSADVCNAAPTSNNYKAPQSAKIPGIAFYGAMDDINKRGEVTAWSAMLFAISTSDPAAMKTQNRMYFNIGTGNTVVLKENVND